jgi:NitT/TauT family transport system permease protein
MTSIEPRNLRTRPQEDGQPALDDPRPETLPNTGRLRSRRRARSVLVTVTFAIVALALGIGIWQAAVSIYHPPKYIIPPPSAVWEALRSLVSTSPSTPGNMWSQLGSTLEGTLFGFLLGSAAGIFLGILAGESDFMRRLLYPYLVAIQSIPKVALVPVFATWFGFGLTAKVALVITLVFFPVLVNTLQGIVMSDPDQIDLLRSLSANRFQRLWRIRIPGAFPMIFTGLELGIVFAFLGSVLTEMQGQQSGLGVMLSTFQTNADTEATFALLIIFAIVGYLLNTIMRIIHKRVVFWESDATARLRATAQNG